MTRYKETSLNDEIYEVFLMPEFVTLRPCHLLLMFSLLKMRTVISEPLSQINLIYNNHKTE